MSISVSLANALSGLSAVSRAADVVSSNVANVMTQGYARREIDLASQDLGGSGAGVRVVGVNRIVNASVLADRRLSGAESGNAGTLADFYTSLESGLGLPGEAGSLSSAVAEFDAALVEAASRPDSEARLGSVFAKATDLADKLNDLDAMIETERSNADAQISTQVDRLNRSLRQVDELNARILAERSSGNDATALMDQRQALVDDIATIVPVREVARERDQIGLYTTGGAILLEGNPATIGFSPAGIVTSERSLANGALSGLTINGMSITSTDEGVLGGGTLGALLTIRDKAAPEAQTSIDAFARDLISRFEAAGLDPTRAAGETGLFTDAGGVLDPAAEQGLAGRIAVNARVDPDAGGALWRLRDGLGAAAPGTVGDATLLSGMAAALGAAQAPASGSFLGAARSASGLAAEILSQVSSARQDTEDRSTFALARSETLTELQLADGVDTDHEMQMLMKIEQAYAANARVIQTIDKLLEDLLGL